MSSLKERAREDQRQIALKRKWAHTTWLKLDSPVYRAAMQLEEAAFTDGALSRKHKELTALAIGVITNCESCMQWHLEQAAKAGASRREVVEAIEVALEMGVVPATVHARFALEVLEATYGDASASSAPK